MPQVLFAGASGRVGHMLRAFWPTEGQRAVWYGRSRQGRPDWVDWRPGQALPASVQALVVLAAPTRGSAAELAEGAVIGRALAQAARAAGLDRVLLVSSMAVYGATPEGGATEDCPPRDPSAYGAAKLAQEEAVEAELAGSATRLCTLRVGNVIGADLLGRLVASGERMVLDRFADGGGPWRSYIGPGQLVEVLLGLMALPQDRLPSRLNVAVPAPMAMADLLDAARIPFVWQPAPETARQHVTMDCTRLSRLLPGAGWQAADAASMVGQWQAARARLAGAGWGA